MSKQDNVVVGLDIGTTKICAIVGEVKEGGRVDIIGIGSHPSNGLRKGVVVNIESTVESIKKAVEEAELMAGVNITAVYAGIAGGHIKSFNSRGVIAVKDREITRTDVERVIDAAKAVAIPMDREVLHVLPQEYSIDGQDGIKEPLGMSGVRLEADVHIVTGAITSAQNIVKSCNRAGLDVLDIVLEPLASSYAVLSPDEKELGVAMVDIGGGTTDIAILLEGGVWHTGVLAIGGNHLTNDIAVGLRTPAAEAEKTKKRYGCALTSLVRDDETIEVASVGGRPPRVLSRQVLSEIIEPRIEEIFGLVMKEIRKTSFEDRIASGVVITGGSAIMDGIPEAAERIMEIPARRGLPMNIGGLVDVVNSPMYATGVGLVLFGAHQMGTGKVRRLSGGNMFEKVFGRMKEWMEGFF
ncbi:MAG: cell division protein FtsA [Nitrospirae bacterium]|nr:cell division protein FtsA [Nitrospirota bacterium]